MEGFKISGVTLTVEAQRHVMTTAVEAGVTYGIGYWAELKSAPRTSDGAVKSITLIDFEGAEPPSRGSKGTKPKRFRISGRDIEAAVNKMLVDPEGTDSKGWIGRLLMDDSVDGPLSDAIIQVACHGRVIYG